MFGLLIVDILPCMEAIFREGMKKETWYSLILHVGISDILGVWMLLYYISVNQLIPLCVSCGQLDTL